MCLVLFGIKLYGTRTSNQFFCKRYTHLDRLTSSSSEISTHVSHRQFTNSWAVKRSVLAHFAWNDRLHVGQSTVVSIPLHVQQYSLRCDENKRNTHTHNKQHVNQFFHYFNKNRKKTLMKKLIFKQFKNNAYNRNFVIQ